MAVDTALYDALGVAPSATQGEIRKAYHKRSLESHPDKRPQEEQQQASQEFQRISYAFEVLSDEQSRSVYDEVGEDGMKRGGGGGGGGGFPGFDFNMDGGEDLNDIFAQMFSGGGGAAPGGGRPRPQRKRRRAPKTTVNYAVTLEDLYNGRQKHFQLMRNVFCTSCTGSGAKPGCQAQECGECKGSGQQNRLSSMGQGYVRTTYVDCQACKGQGMRVKERDRCKKCKGEKITKQKSKLDVNIIPGMQNGQKIVFRDQGDCVVNCKLPGHLVIILKYHQHESITLSNNDLQVQSSITLSESLLGFNRAVFTHLDGRSIRINSPAGRVIRPGDASVIRGLGMPSYKGSRLGDLYIQWTIDFPPDNFLSSVDGLKLQSLLPPKRSDWTSEYTKVDGKLNQERGGTAKDEEEGEVDGSTTGLGFVQDCGAIQIARIDEFGSHTLPPVDDDDGLSDDEDYDEQGGQSCIIA